MDKNQAITQYNNRKENFNRQCDVLSIEYRGKEASSFNILEHKNYPPHAALISTVTEGGGKAFEDLSRP